MNTEGTVEIPEEALAIKQLLDTESDDIDVNDPRFGLITWTSKEMLQRTIASGILLDRSPSAAEIGAFKDDQIVGIALPGLEHFDNFPKNDDVRFFLENPSEAKDYARYSARRLAGVHYFLDQLNLPFDNPALTNALGSYIFATDPEIQAFLTEKSGSDDSSIRQIIDASADLLPHLPSDFYDQAPSLAAIAREKKGLILAINTPPASTGFKLVGTLTPEDPHILFSFGLKGMSYKQIGANVPLGEDEKTFYTALKHGK